MIFKYKKEIEKYVYPSGNNLVLKESEARKLIKTIRKMKVVELDIELELHYVDCCLDVITDFGYWDENFYLSVDKMYNSAVNGIAELGLIDEYAERLENISARASEFGTEFFFIKNKNQPLTKYIFQPGSVVCQLRIPASQFRVLRTRTLSEIGPDNLQVTVAYKTVSH